MQFVKYFLVSPVLIGWLGDKVWKLSSPGPEHGEVNELPGESKWIFLENKF